MLFQVSYNCETDKIETVIRKLSKFFSGKHFVKLTNIGRLQKIKLFGTINFILVLQHFD